MQSIDKEDQMRGEKYYTVAGEIGRDGEQEVIRRTVKGKDGRVESEMDRKGRIQLDTEICYNKVRQ